MRERCLRLALLLPGVVQKGAAWAGTAAGALNKEVGVHGNGEAVPVGCMVCRLHRVGLQGVVLHRGLLHRVVLHRVVLHRVGLGLHRVVLHRVGLGLHRHGVLLNRVVLHRVGLGVVLHRVLLHRVGLGLGMHNLHIDLLCFGGLLSGGGDGIYGEGERGVFTSNET